MIPRQRRIDGTNLPDARLRFEQAERGYQRLTAAGYIPVGFDHFALPEDSLAAAAREGRVNRNFQGFTEDDAPVLIGFGASAISRFPDLIVQNEKKAGPYRDIVAGGRLAGVRGVPLDHEQQRRARHIRDLLCSGRAHLDPSEDAIARKALMIFEERGIVGWDETDLVIRDGGLPYARHVAAEFDRVRGHMTPPVQA